MNGPLVDALGLDRESMDLTFQQVCLRGVVIFISGLMLVRVADKRFFAKKTAFDVLLVFLLGSMLGRAVNGPEPLFATIGAAFGIILLHRWIGWAALRSRAFGNVVKGHTAILVKDGLVDSKALAAHRLSLADLQEEVRLQANVDDLSEVAFAYLERNGEISIVKARHG